MGSNKIKLSLSNNSFVINDQTAKKLNIETGSKIDFSFEDNSLFLILNPNDGIELRILGKNKKGLTFKNKTLTNCLIDFFSIDADKNTYLLNVSDKPNEDNKYLITM